MRTDLRSCVPENLLAFYQEVSRNQALAQQSLAGNFEVNLRTADNNSGNIQHKPTVLEKVTIRADKDVFGQVFREIVLAAYKFTDDQDQVLELFKASREVDISDCFEEALQGNYHEVASRLGVLNPTSIRYFCDLAVQPFLRVLAVKAETYRDLEWDENYCPVCGRSASFSVFSDGSRTLVCGSCELEWMYPYLKCSSCGNSDHVMLGYMLPEGVEGEKVFTCKKCSTYIKMFDRDALRETDMQLVDLTTMYLDLIAASKGFNKEASALSVLN